MKSRTNPSALEKLRDRICKTTPATVGKSHHRAAVHRANAAAIARIADDYAQELLEYAEDRGAKVYKDQIASLPEAEIAADLTRKGVAASKKHIAAVRAEINRLTKPIERPSYAVGEDEIAEIIQHVAKPYAQELQRHAEDKGRPTSAREIAGIPERMIASDLREQGASGTTAQVRAVRAAIKTATQPRASRDNPAMSKKANRNPSRKAGRMSVTIRLNEDETAVYHGEDAREQDELIRELHKMAREETRAGRHVEIYDSDGITLLTFEPEHYRDYDRY